MTFTDIVRFAGGNLWRRRTRTLLTVVGVFIGTACITLMAGLALGNYAQFNENIMQNSNLTRIEVYSNNGAGDRDELDETAVASFRSLSGVRSATGLTELPGYIQIGRYVYGGSVTAADIRALSLEYEEGGPFPDTDAVEFVIGSNAREWFTDPHGNRNMDVSWSVSAISYDEEEAEPAGPDIDWLDAAVLYWPSWGDPEDEETTPERPAPKEYRASVCGMLAPAYDQESYSVFISPKAAARIFSENRKRLQADGVRLDRYDRAYIDAVDVEAVESILEAVQAMGFEVYSDTQWIASMREEQARQQSQLIAIGMVSLVVSAIGIANTMLASILERRREIGVMKVIGLSVRKIHMMFLAESAMIGLIGGLIGIGISWVIAAVASSGETSVSFLGLYFDQGVQLLIPWWLALGAVLVAVGVGILSGIYPAWRATRMSPLEAIREQN